MRGAKGVVGAWVDHDAVFCCGIDGDEGGACGAGGFLYQEIGADVFLGEVIAVGLCMRVLTNASEQGDVAAGTGGSDGLIGSFSAKRDPEFRGGHGFPWLREL